MKFKPVDWAFVFIIAITLVGICGSIYFGDIEHLLWQIMMGLACVVVILRGQIK